ncbi:MAG: chemotaxis protein CheA, partial [Actinomycetia bacterium]|nr:chemotaxis protein CheA [Actinomycetes bacterium]
MTNDEQLIQDFVTESQEHLADIETDILAIEATGDNIDVELVNKVFRAVHSIKGASGFLGFTTIGELAHHLENILNLVRGSELTLTSAITDVLLRAADTLRALINNISESNEVDVSEHVRALQAVVAGDTTEEVRECMERMVTVSGPDGVDFEVSEHAILSQQRAGHHLYLLDFDLIADVQDQGKTPIQLIHELTAYGEIVASKLDSASCGDLADTGPMKLPFHVLFGSILEADFVPEAFSLAEEHVHPIDSAAVLQGSGDTPASPAGSAPPAQEESPVQAQNVPVAAVQPKSAPKPKPAPVSPSPAKPGPAAPAAPKDTNIRVSVALLDHLMNLVGELVLSRNQLMQAIISGRTEGLPTVGVQLDRITSELQESVMQTRMQPIATVFGKFPRVVRDLSGQLNKKCELVMQGQEVELDKSIIEAIGDPLTHLVRNSVDHGVELPDQRTAQGKNAAGTITLRAFHQAGKVNIEIVDDGAGIDVQRIKQKAVEKGLLTPDRVNEVGDREALRFIFAAGFSMAKEVTDVSGRGVGMDVVRTNIEKLGGTVDIESELGKGTTMRIRLPLTLAIIPSLIVRCGDERFALPQVGISELVRIKPSEVERKIERVKDAEVLRLRGNLLPLVRLSTVLEQKSKYVDPGPQVLRDNEREHIADRREDADEQAAQAELRSGDPRRADTPPGALNIIVLETAHLKYGLIVDELFDSEEIVVKPLGHHLKDSACLAGATILGDGGVAMILDVAGMAATAELSAPEEQDG